MVDQRSDWLTVASRGLSGGRAPVRGSDWLTGDWLTGDWLTGDWLTGDWLTGDWLTGAG